MQPVAERLAGLLPDGALRLSSQVRRITQSDGAVLVEAAGTVVQAARAVVAVPPTLAGRIEYDPPLPARLGSRPSTPPPHPKSMWSSPTAPRCSLGS